MEFYCQKEKGSYEIYRKMDRAERCITWGDTGLRRQTPCVLSHMQILTVMAAVVNVTESAITMERQPLNTQVRGYLGLASLWAWLFELILSSLNGVGRAGQWRQTHSLGQGPEGIKRKWAELTTFITASWLWLP